MSDDLIRRSDAIKATWQEPTYTDPLNVLTEVRDRIEAIPSADRPSGEVDAVKEYERQVHNLNQGYINLGEFDKRIEPLRHLHYDRPQGEWIMHIDDLFPCESTQECSVCHAEQLINGNDDNFCPNCGADMRERSECYGNIHRALGSDG